MGTCVDCGRSAEGLTCCDWPNCCGQRVPGAFTADYARLRDLAHYWQHRALSEEAKSRRTIADLRDRLRILAPMVCGWCGCAPASGDGFGPCPDCQEVKNVFWLDLPAQYSTTGACISVGLRALCGRRLLEGCE